MALNMIPLFLIQDRNHYDDSEFVQNIFVITRFRYKIIALCEQWQIYE